MRYDNLRQKVRELALSLAYEEEVGHRFKNWWGRKRDHDSLLRKLYKLEARK
jgi:hypothetical protein